MTRYARTISQVKEGLINRCFQACSNKYAKIRSIAVDLGPPRRPFHPSTSHHGTRHVDDAGIDDGAPAHLQAVLLEVLINQVKQLIAQIMNKSEMP